MKQSASSLETNQSSTWSIKTTPGSSGVAGTAHIQLTDTGRSIKKKKFFVKGVAYSPVPAGAGTGEPQVGDWFYSVPDTPNTWNQIWKRDLPNMKAMGLNVLKTYFFWPKAPPTASQMPNWQSTVQGEEDRDHSDFLAAARKNGLYVLIGVALDAGNIFSNPDPSKAKNYKDYYKWVCKELAARYGDHPAVMGFVLGNEMNNPTRLQSSDYWNINAEFVQEIRAGAPHKLVVQAMQNDTDLFTYNITEKKGKTKSLLEVYSGLYDLWAVNVFDGNSFDTFLSRFKKQVAETDYILPMLFTEYGVPAGKNNNDNTKVVELPHKAKVVGTYLSSLYVSMTTSTALAYCCGGSYFEYCDEWWKGNGAGNCDHTTPSNNPSGAFPGGYWEPSWWGLYSIAPNSRHCSDGPWNNNATPPAPYPPDTLTARSAVSVMSDLAIPSGFVGG